MRAGSSTERLADLERRLGHSFADRDLLLRALTHISFLPGDRSRLRSYQRLEFLGDRVLGLVVSAMLIEAFPSAEEGELSRRLAGLVRKETCAEVAAEWDVPSHIRLGDSEAQAGGQARPAIMGDVCEALIGAVYLDGGFAVAEPVVRAAWKHHMHAPSRPLRDAKTALQEWAQSLGRAAPVYREVGRQGPDHAPVFTVSVDVEGFTAGLGVGASKRVAEQTAAQAFMVREGITQTERA